MGAPASREAEGIVSRHPRQFIVAYVFGSVAAGTADRCSDVEVILVCGADLPFFDRVREVMDLRLARGAADLLIYTPTELAWTLNREERCRQACGPHGIPD